MTGTARRVGTGVAAAAAMIAGVTVAARVVGLLRTVVFARTVGPTSLGDVYTTANAVPNLVFEVIAGGALVGAVVPVLAGPLARGRRDDVRQTVAALVGWVLLLLVPAAALVAVATPWIVGALLGDAASGAQGQQLTSVAERMLLLFAPQIPLYGLAVVGQGVLQSGRRFLMPALAPLLSSVVVICGYLGYGVAAGEDRGDVATLTTGQLLLLAGGTTVGVLVLAASQWPGVGRLGLLARPRLSFPGDTGARVRALALAGLGAVAAQQVTVAVGLRLANDHGEAGSAFTFTMAWTVFLLPWAVLAVPVATSAFPQLAEQHHVADGEGFRATTAATTRAVLLVSVLGAAALAAVAVPLADLLVLGAPGGTDPGRLAEAITAFAPGLVGFGLVAHLSRVLYARHRGGLSSVVVVSGWAVVVLADTLLARAAAPGQVVTALGVGTSLGLSLAGVLLLVAVAVTQGRDALRGTPRAALAGLLAGVPAVAVGRWLADLLPVHGPGGAVVVGVAVGTVVVVGYGLVVLVADGADLRPMLQRRLRGARS